MNAFHFNEKHLFHTPALQLLIKQKLLTCHWRVKATTDVHGYNTDAREDWKGDCHA